MFKSPELLDNCVQPIRYTDSARTAFRIILDGLDFTDGKKLLLPAYIGVTDREGSGVYDPVLDTATPHDFYAVDRKLSAEKGSLYECISSGQYKAVLVIHYFGFCQNDMERISVLCKENGVLLIEDCAHAMGSEVTGGQLGALGDFSLYSVHKILATQGGGYLRVNNHDYRAMLKTSTGASIGKDALEMLARVDMSSVVELRRFNYQAVTHFVSGCRHFHAMYSILPDGIVPHNFPVVVRGKEREECYFGLIDYGIPVTALYYQMIDPIKSENFPDSIYVSENILNIPIHQDLAKNDLLLIQKGLVEVDG